MRRHITLTASVFSIICLFVAIFFGGCGGDGGGSAVTSSCTGTVAVFVADGPADGYDHIWIHVTEVSLIPSHGYGPDPVVIFHCPEGYRVDLLAYRYKDFLLTRTENVPAWQYEKVRLKVKKIESDPPCDSEGWKLPSNKIDLNPRGPFEVKPGETLLIRLDIDANKSINAHPAGTSEKCIFRPVVFVDIEAVMLPQLCPLILTGTITEPIDRDENGVIEQFTLQFPDRPGAVPVQLTPETVIFQDDGSVGDASALAEGQTVWVRGRLDEGGRLQASVIIIGDVSTIKGTVASAVDGNSFYLLPDDETAPVVEVTLSEESLVFFGCDTEAGIGDIQPELRAEVIGKDSLAILVFLQPEEISGQLIAIEPTGDGDDLTGKDLHLTIKPDDGEAKTVFFPKYTPIYLQGDGEVLVNLLCPGRQLRVLLDPMAPDLTAIVVQIQSDVVEGEVLNHISTRDERTLLIQVEGETEPLLVHVQNGTTILDLRGDEDTLVDFDDINMFDQVRCYGLDACPEDSGFYAFVILIIGPAP